MTTIERLLFVYNADSGKLAAIVDSAKKLLSINGCALCTITHGLTGEKDDWKSCREEIGVPVDYVHRDELTAEIGVGRDDLPCVVAIAEGKPIVLLERGVLERCRGSVADLRGRLNTHAALKGLQFPERVAA